VWQAREHIPKISKRIKSAPAATFDDGVDNGAAFAGLGIANKEPVFLFMASLS
jgi:hypothetical protein